ncbi:MAG: hypothetical protein AOA66_1392 [Candidatus Bathyarchaeota archaeon BA2]|nr:MAG: hypothetical protein AOA66_1392 [Candidatus Bathyarchaeota archaeon BA2]
MVSLRTIIDVLLIAIGFVLVLFGMTLFWRIEYTGPMGTPTYPFTIPGTILSFIGGGLVTLGFIDYARR